MSTKRPFLCILIGMIVGGLIGFFIFFNIDKSKGWNPYGWWLAASFALTIVGGISGILIYVVPSRNKRLENQMAPEILTIIEKGKELKRTIGELVTKFDYPQSDKDLLIIAYHSIFVEHHDSIHLLIEKQLYGSAFALVRSLYESLYRAHWVNGCAIDDQIKQIIRGKDVFPKMHVMVGEIDERYKTEDFWQIVKKNSWTAMNDYTHSGMRQLSRRFVQDSVEPNYNIGEIKEVLDGTNVALLLIAFFFFNVYQKVAEVKLVGEMILRYNES